MRTISRRAQWMAALMLVASAIVGVVLWARAPRVVPAGQHALTTLSPDTLTEFRAAFNAGIGRVRVLAFLSPTCPVCVEGAEAFQAMLDEFGQPVSAFAIWEPVLPTDIVPPFNDTLALLHSPNARQLWDPDNLLSDEMRRGMLAHPSDIPVTRMRTGEREDGTLWDAVVIFGPEARWDDTLPAPLYLDGLVVDVGEAVVRVLRGQVAASGAATAWVPPWEPADEKFRGCEGGCGERATGEQAGVVTQPGAQVGQLTYCPVSGVVFPVTDRSPHRELEGSKGLYFCCESCATHFSNNREGILAKRGTLAAK